MAVYGNGVPEDLKKRSFADINHPAFSWRAIPNGQWVRIVRDYGDGFVGNFADPHGLLVTNVTQLLGKLPSELPPGADMSGTSECAHLYNEDAIGDAC